jgi:hypothetical protein
MNKLLVDEKMLTDTMEKVAGVFKTEMKIYLLGGSAMLMTQDKDSTKDIDMVVENKADRRTFENALKKAGFLAISLIPEEKALDTVVFFQNDIGLRFDIFVEKVANRLFYTEDMRLRAIEILKTGKLTVYKTSDEDLFLLKAVSGRDRDMTDLSALFKKNLDWDVILSECRQQRKLTGRVWSVIMLETLNDLEEQYKLRCKKRRDFERLAEEDLKAIIKRKR